MTNAPNESAELFPTFSAIKASAADVLREVTRKAGRDMFARRLGFGPTRTTGAGATVSGTLGSSTIGGPVFWPQGLIHIAGQQPGGGPFDFNTHAGEPLANSVVAACVNAIAQALPDAPVYLEKRNGQNWDKVHDHPALDSLRWPNEYHSAADVWGLTVGQERTRGQAFWIIPQKEKQVDANRKIAPAQRKLEIWPVESDKVTIEGTEDEFIARYWIQSEKGEAKPYDNSEVIHFRHMLNWANPRGGWAPILTGRRQIAGDNAAATYHSAILHNSGVMSLLISYKEAAAGSNPGQIETFVKALKEKLFGVGAGGIAGTNLPLDVHKMSYSPDEMALSQLISYYETRIAILIGVDPMVTGLGSGTTQKTYANFAEAIEDFWRRCIVPMRNRHAATLTAQYLPLFGLDPSQWRVAFDYSNVAALQEDADALHGRVREDWKAQLLDKKQARTLLGYAGDEPDEAQFEGVFFGGSEGSEDGSEDEPETEETEIEAAPENVKAWNEAEHPRNEKGEFADGHVALNKTRISLAVDSLEKGVTASAEHLAKHRDIVSRALNVAHEHGYIHNQRHLHEAMVAHDTAYHAALGESPEARLLDARRAMGHYLMRRAENSSVNEQQLAQYRGEWRKLDLQQLETMRGNFEDRRRVADFMGRGGSSAGDDKATRDTEYLLVLDAIINERHRQAQRLVEGKALDSPFAALFGELWTRERISEMFPATQTLPLSALPESELKALLQERGLVMRANGQNPNTLTTGALLDVSGKMATVEWQNGHCFVGGHNRTTRLPLSALTAVKRYDPNQPRNEGGEWTSGGSGGASGKIPTMTTPNALPEGWRIEEKPGINIRTVENPAIGPDGKRRKEKFSLVREAGTKYYVFDAKGKERGVTWDKGEAIDLARTKNEQDNEQAKQREAAPREVVTFSTERTPNTVLVARYSDDIDADIKRGWSAWQHEMYGGTRADVEKEAREQNLKNPDIRKIPQGGYALVHHEGLSCYPLNSESVDDAQKEVVSSTADGSGYGHHTVGEIRKMRTIPKELIGSLRDLHILEVKESQPEVH